MGEEKKERRKDGRGEKCGAAVVVESCGVVAAAAKK
jgi:hypothetical protein